MSALLGAANGAKAKSRLRFLCDQRWYRHKTETVLSTLLVATVLLCGCSTTKFTEYHGSEVFQGVGGEARVVDGIDFWENEDSSRKYKILGVIEENPKHRLPLGRFSSLFSGSSDRDSAIAKAARERGGDAVIFVATDQESANVGQSGDANHRRITKFVVVKYVE